MIYLQNLMKQNEGEMRLNEVNFYCLWIFEKYFLPCCR